MYNFVSNNNIQFYLSSATSLYKLSLTINYTYSPFAFYQYYIICIYLFKLPLTHRVGTQLVDILLCLPILKSLLISVGGNVRKPTLVPILTLYRHLSNEEEAGSRISACARAPPPRIISIENLP